MIRVLYLAHDLSDAGIGRRVEMLRAGGADVQVVGFSRGDHNLPKDILTVELGRTENARLGLRAASVARARATLEQWLRPLATPDVIIARNLEMLALAPAVQRFFHEERPPIVYECLDIHRLMLRADLVGRGLRAAERRLGRSVDLLWTSSPAFLRNYFEPHGTVPAPARVIENKFLDLGVTPATLQRDAPSDKIRIGWFGILRCARSLKVLDAVSRAAAGRIEVLLCGKPAYDAIPLFDETIAANPHLCFEGPYRYPDDLASIYSQVHFSWLVDWYDAGLNSEWLLPNRLYEGCRFGAVPIARAGTEIAHRLRELEIGVVLDDLEAVAIAKTIAALDEASVAELTSAVASTGPHVWSANVDTCRELVADLARLRSSPNLLATSREVRG